MALPADGTAWPPIAAEVRTALEDWAAWYSANPNKIADRYYWRSTRVGQYGQQPVNRPSQYRRGLVGAMARFFWGEPTPWGEKRIKLHVPLAGDLARTSSALLFSEPPTLKAPDPKAAGAKPLQERLEQLQETGLNRTLITAGQRASALGGVYLRTVWDDEISDRPWIDSVRADAAAPEMRAGVLMAVTFWTVIAVDGTKVTRHLERHERGGLILHAVYEGSSDNLGKQLPDSALGSFPETKGLQPTRQLAIDKLMMTVSYAPNTADNRDWCDVPGAHWLGLSDFQGSEGLLDALDETYTSWMRDVRLAKSRIIVPHGYLTNHGLGQGASWEDRDVYAGLNIPPTETGAGITLNQFAIRHAEHKATCDELRDQIIRNAGYNTGSFGEDSDGAAVTATEVKAKASRSEATRSSKSEAFAVAVPDIVETLLALEASGLFPGLPSVDVERPVMTFADSIAADPLVLAQTAAALRTAEAASTETLVALTNPEMPAEEQAVEVRRIHAENGRTVASPDTAGGHGANLPGDSGDPVPPSP
ncbi:capsid protein [Streptomyces sp. V4-01]|uniref:Capsid protein n=1 Tax=Actinacidiphila polyblastidii TaxID=3110430 RepID=A0ABU7P589_9ACTN|nr:capsid protein [Streptomyces sp. V4-01]